MKPDEVALIELENVLLPHLIEWAEPTADPNDKKEIKFNEELSRANRVLVTVRYLIARARHHNHRALARMNPQSSSTTQIKKERDKWLTPL